MSSTLKPGKTSDMVRKLREKALQEMDATPEGVAPAGELEFDYDHDDTESNDSTQAEFDRSNWVAKYPGQNSPHIGNGSGGTR